MIWQQLIKAALLGTENHHLSAADLDYLQAQGIDAQREMPLVLAEAVAVFAQMRKAGFQLNQFQGELPQVAQMAEDKPCSPQGIRHLELILSGKYEALLPEFVRFLHLYRKVLPAEHLPFLLARPDARFWLEQLQPGGIGTAARWLLAQHPDWRHWLYDASGVDWATASKLERLQLLRFLRKNNPDQALDLLQSTWAEETYKDKTDFIAVLETDRSFTDEHFLETCLDEKRKEVRQAAALVLAKIPGSRFAQRMLERSTRRCFHLKQNALTLQLPEEPDEAAQRDGIIKIHPGWQGGVKASYLGQLVSQIEPGQWEVFFQKNPSEILTLFSKTDWSATLLAACKEAVLQFENQDWADALILFRFEKDALSQVTNLPVFRQLAAVVSPACFNQVALQQLENQSVLPDAQSPLYLLLQHSPQPWDDALSMKIIGRLQTWLANNARSDWQTYHYKDFLKLAALHANPALLEPMRNGWPAQSAYWALWERPVEEMLDLLLFRKEMREAFESA